MCRARPVLTLLCLRSGNELHCAFGWAQSRQIGMVKCRSSEILLQQRSNTKLTYGCSNYMSLTNILDCFSSPVSSILRNTNFYHPIYLLLTEMFLVSKFRNSNSTYLNYCCTTTLPGANSLRSPRSCCSRFWIHSLSFLKFISCFSLLKPIPETLIYTNECGTGELLNVNCQHTSLLSTTYNLQ